jgi:hypothetical protein
MAINKFSRLVATTVSSVVTTVACHVFRFLPLKQSIYCGNPEIMNSYRPSSSRIVDNNEVAIQLPPPVPSKLSLSNNNGNSYNNGRPAENPASAAVGDFNPLNKLNDRIQTIYSKWNTQGAINVANQDVMAEAATALAIHQYASKYPIYIAAGAEFKEAVQAQTCFHEARRADRENRVTYKNAYKEHMAVGVVKQIGYDVKMYVRENKANIIATLGLAIALIVLFVQINAKIADINDNRLTPLVGRVSTVESSAAQAQGKVDTVNAQLDSVQATIVKINAQSAAANASIVAMNQVVNSFNVSSYVTQVNQLTNAGIPQLLSTASSAQQLCTEAQRNFTNMQSVVLQASLNQTAGQLSSLNDRISQSANKSVLLLDLSKFVTSNPAAYANAAWYITNGVIPFNPGTSVGPSNIQCVDGVCTLAGPAAYHLHIDIFALALITNTMSADYGWTLGNGVKIGTYGRLVTSQPYQTVSSAEAFITVPANQTVQVSCTIINFTGPANGLTVYGASLGVPYSSASIVQL